MINEYCFGSITIDEKTYTNDVEIRWSGQVLDWQRKESHVIDVEDVKRAVEQNPEVIVIGIGESGVAKVTEAAQNFIKEKGIELIVDITDEAVKTFNILAEESEGEAALPRFARQGESRPTKVGRGAQKKVIGLFHLTC